jgi:hypothetical protein
MWFHFPALPLALTLALLGLDVCSALGQDQCAGNPDLPNSGNITKAQLELPQPKSNKVVQEGIENNPAPALARRVHYRHLPLIDLSKKAQQLLEREISDIESTSSEHIVVSVPRDWTRSIRSPPLEALFPNYDFIYIPYHMTQRPGSTSHVSLPGLLFRCLAIDASAGTVARFYAGGDHAEFGSFLAAQKVTLKTEDDAVRVFQALCAVRNRPLFSGKHLRAENGHWKLNWQTHRQTIASGKHVTKVSYYEIRTDEKGTVISGRLRGEEIPDPD